MKKYVCTVCGYVYDESAGIPEAGIAPGTRWEELPADWCCPLCGAAKSDFKEQGVSSAPAAPAPSSGGEPTEEGLRELSPGELSALCSNLARGCGKQYLAEESGLFAKLAEYYRANTLPVEDTGMEGLAQLIQGDLSDAYPKANGEAAAAGPDRGAMRALLWSEKVTRILSSLLGRYQREGGAFLEHTNVYVCEICGFVYVGDTPPEICPICKVPKMKLAKLQRR